MLQAIKLRSRTRTTNHLCVRRGEPAPNRNLIFKSTTRSHNLRQKLSAPLILARNNRDVTIRGRSANRCVVPPGKGHFTSSQSILLLVPKPRIIRGSEEHTSELQSRSDLVCRLLLEK